MALPRVEVPDRGPRVPTVLAGRWGGRGSGDMRVVWRKAPRQEQVLERKLGWEVGVPPDLFVESFNPGPA